MTTMKFSFVPLSNAKRRMLPTQSSCLPCKCTAAPDPLRAHRKLPSYCFQTPPRHHRHYTTPLSTVDGSPSGTAQQPTSRENGDSPVHDPTSDTHLNVPPSKNTASSNTTTPPNASRLVQRIYSLLKQSPLSSHSTAQLRRHIMPQIPPHWVTSQAHFDSCLRRAQQLMHHPSRKITAAHRAYIAHYVKLHGQSMPPAQLYTHLQRETSLSRPQIRDIVRRVNLSLTRHNSHASRRDLVYRIRSIMHDYPHENSPEMYKRILRETGLTKQRARLVVQKIRIQHQYMRITQKHKDIIQDAIRKFTTQHPGSSDVLEGRLDDSQNDSKLKQKQKSIVNYLLQRLPHGRDQIRRHVRRRLTATSYTQDLKQEIVTLVNKRLMEAARSPNFSFREVNISDLSSKIEEEFTSRSPLSRPQLYAQIRRAVTRFEKKHISPEQLQLVKDFVLNSEYATCEDKSQKGLLLDDLEEQSGLSRALLHDLLVPLVAKRKRERKNESM